LDQLGVARRTFYRWYDRYLEGGPEALADRSSTPIPEFVTSAR
jgi:putative transposase